MTGPEMNGRRMKKIDRRSSVAFRPVPGMVAVGALALILAGCAGAFEADMTDSPISTQVQALVDANRTYPRWEDFPKASADTPAPAQVATRVAALNAADQSLRSQLAGMEWRSVDAETFARETRARVEAAQPSPATAQTEADIEAFAERLRARGKAPPPIGRRQ